MYKHQQTKKDMKRRTETPMFNSELTVQCDGGKRDAWSLESYTA